MIMKEIIAALLIWLGANSDYTVNMDVPPVILLPQVEMENIYYGEAERHGHLHAFYNTEEDVIYLPDTWDGTNPWDLGVLLHEVIHYVQDQNDLSFACKNAMEKESWPLQQRYLKEVHDFQWDYDRLWHHMISTCANQY